MDFPGSVANNGGLQIEVGRTAYFIGDVTFAASSQLQIELGGTLRGDQYDAVDVAKTASLDGTLAFQSVAPYTDPDVAGSADTFLVISAGSRSGTFSDISYGGTPLTAEFTSGDSFRDHVGGGLFRNLTYTATQVELQNLLALPGDADGDVDVDIADFNTRIVHE